MDGELEFLEKRIREDKKACEEMRRQEENKKVAKFLHDIYSAYVNEGFSEEQSFWLIAQMIKTAFKKI